MAKLTKITRTVLSYSEIPEDIADSYSTFNCVSQDCYVEVRITPRNEQDNFDDNFSFENWVIDEHPELEGQTILIKIDY